MMLILDLDGTLIDSRRDLTRAINAMRASYGLAELPVEEVVGYVGNGAQRLVERSLTDVSGIDVQEALKRMKESYLENLVVDTTLYDGVVDTLEELVRREIPLAVVSNKPDEATGAILKHFGIAGYFDQVVGAGRMALKPDPEALEYCLTACRERPEISWMVGDHYTDLEAGRRAGMKRAFAAWGFGEPRDESYEARLDGFRDLLTLQDR